ncbi:ATP-binding cassette domain-containing protein [Siccirubricoccus sp. KC 17139]|uniref:ATP-binding cassette domain-containing protein n=1 Tax=Siccirubricoccus soli TaxID=2899147 RepID=A0ABT1DAB6_9PROT|nr:oligopeptide/dipeptide ABC transporter ATP-binding protein [Siccirubricoccus soli]MCO6418888.1 ATP-binding cassette domain-containing protein [Siccirubricoccus soli]MCP2685023.1 ATP-binding cassette domain-containing protein [Siccirubricoccus soli]
MTKLLEVSDLKKHFPIKAGFFGGTTGYVYAVDGVSFSIEKGETLSLVGESGCGKSTVGKAILRLFDITSGQVVLDGKRIDDMPAGSLRPLRRRVQVVFQDPFSSLNPRMKVKDILAEPIRNFGLAKDSRDLDERVAKLMDTVRLPRDAVNRWPHEFSGGQRQRIGIARALAAEPDLIVCDEAVSALDVSVKAQIVNLLQDLQQELGLALLFISHDLAIVEHMTHRVAVMYLGKIVEVAPKRSLFAAPKHPYTQALLSAVPVPEPGASRQRIILKGDVPSPINPPKGCRFHTRCPYAFDRCRVEEPKLAQPATAGAGHVAACHLHSLPDAENPLAAAVGELVVPA